MRIRSVFFVLGVLLAVFGLTMGAPVAVSLMYGEYEAAQSMALSIPLISGCGVLACFLCRPRRGQSIQLDNRGAVGVVGLCWLTCCLAGAIPYVWVGNLSWAHAFFETASGFTTTGSSILSNIEIVPRGLLFWRSLTQWMGGMGIIVFSLALLPFLGAGGMQLYRAEVTGPLKDKVAPRMKDTARSLWKIYVLLTVLLIVILRVEGMDWYDAVNHSFTTLATGGFSTRNASLAAFSPLIQWTVTLFMFVAGINFSLHVLAMRGKRRIYVHNTECMLYTVLTLAGGFTIAALLVYQGGSIEPSLRAAFFQVVSLCTTTGFATDNYLNWPLLAQGFLYAFILMGACAASTAGGIKVMRVALLWKMVGEELRRLVHPRAVKHVKMDGRSVSPEVLQGVVAFFVVFLALNFLGALVLMAQGQDFLTAFSAASTCLSNVGPGFGSVGPADNFGFLPDISLWTLSLLMLLGRLEIFTLFILFLPVYWRN